MSCIQGAMAFTTNSYFQFLAILYYKTSPKTDTPSSVWLKPVTLQLVLSLSPTSVKQEFSFIIKLSSFYHIFSVCSVHEVSCHMLGLRSPRLLSYLHLPHGHCDTKQKSHLLLGKASDTKYFICRSDDTISLIRIQAAGASDSHLRHLIPS